MGQVVFFGKELRESDYVYDINRRQIHLFLDKGMNRIKCGVYKLWVGDHFYIGRANNIRTRCKQHMKDMEYMICYKKEKGAGQKNILQYLLAHPKCNKLRVEILEECEPSLLQATEQKWINKHLQDRKMLNTNLKATATRHDRARQEFVPGIYKIEYKVSTVDQYLELKKMIIYDPAAIGIKRVKSF